MRLLSRFDWSLSFSIRLPYPTAGQWPFLFLSAAQRAILWEVPIPPLPLVAVACQTQKGSEEKEKKRTTLLQDSTQFKGPQPPDARDHLPHRRALPHHHHHICGLDQHNDIFCRKHSPLGKVFRFVFDHKNHNALQILQFKGWIVRCVQCRVVSCPVWLVQ